MFENGKLIAAIELFHEKWAKRIRVTELWVDEKARRRGIGSELMTFAKQKTQESDCRMLILETQSCNVAAIDFYRSQGLELVGVLTCDYQNDDIERKEVRFEMGVVRRDRSALPTRRKVTVCVLAIFPCALPIMRRGVFFCSFRGRNAKRLS